MLTNQHVELSADAVQQDADARVGRTLRDKWHLERLLGVGGMAAVYAATHRNGMRGAVKMLHRAQSDDPEVRSRFLREGYIANKVDHDGVVRVLDDDVSDDGSAFLVMELLEGQALHERAANAGGRLAVDEVLVVADRLLDVLAAAHDKGIVHRDIKPENIFVTGDGRIKVLDFGIARIAEPAVASATSTLTGEPMGTPAFMAPEQARGRWDLVGPKSDLWSVGATMFMLLSGQFVHDEETVPEMLAAAFMKPARPLSSAWPGAPISVVEIVDRALAMSPDDRWADARAMRQAVRGAYGMITGEAIPSLAPARVRVGRAQDDGAMSGAATRPAKARRAPGAAVGAAGAAVVAVVVALATFGGRNGATAMPEARAQAQPTLAALAETQPPGEGRDPQITTQVRAALTQVGDAESSSELKSAAIPQALAPTAAMAGAPSQAGSASPQRPEAKATPVPRPRTPATLKALFDRRH